MARLVENQPAYILHRRLYRESSYLLDVFTLNHGRVSIVAKGATRGKKNRSALLQVFQPLLIDWSGRSSLKTLINVEAPDKPFNLASRFLYCGYYLNELILKLSPEMESNPELFVCYGDTLPRLTRHSHIEAVLRHFEFQLLVLLGLAPDFSHCESGAPIMAEQRYVLTVNDGFVTQGAYAKQAQNALIRSFDGATLRYLAQGWFAERRTIGHEPQNNTDPHIDRQTKAVFREAKTLMRQLIDQALQGRVLESRELFKHIARSQ